MAQKDISLTLSAARNKMCIGATDVPDIQACLNTLLPPTFLVHLLDVMNRGTTTTTRLTTQDIQVFLHVLLLLHRHRCSLSDLFSELKHGANSLYGLHPELVGADVIFTRCLNGLSFSPNTEHRGLEWNESQTLDPTIADAAKGMPSAITNDVMFLIQEMQCTYYTIE